MLPRDLDAPPSEAERTVAFCGGCAHFDVWALGGGGDCHKGHDCAARAAAGTCADKRELGRGTGPAFDMSE